MCALRRMHRVVRVHARVGGTAPEYAALAHDDGQLLPGCDGQDAGGEPAAAAPRVAVGARITSPSASSTPQPHDERFDCKGVLVCTGIGEGAEVRRLVVDRAHSRVAGCDAKPTGC